MTSRSTLIVITGASRGIGRACAVAFAKDPRFPNIHLSLLARSQEGLAQTESLVIASAGAVADANETDKKTVTTYIQSMDLSDLTSLEDDFKTALNHRHFDLDDDDKNQRCPYDKAIFINNAGSTGYVGPSNALPSPKELQTYLDLNVAGSLWMSSYFLQHFSSISTCTKVVVNISSLCGIQPFRTMGMYCAGKAARDMFHKTMAEEEKRQEEQDQQEQQQNVNGNARTRILNYAPGAIETEMTDVLSNTATLDSDIRNFFQTSKKENTFIQPHQTAERLVNLIFQDDYENGAHVDYWDLEPQPGSK